MKKSLLLLVVFIGVLVRSEASGKWTAYMSYFDVTKNTCVNGKTYALASGSLYCYTPEKINLMSRISGLSDVMISYFVYNRNLSKFIIVYSNYNIDIMDTEDNVVNVPQYKNSFIQDKTINDVSVAGDYAYLSTNFGVVVINMERCEFTNTYDFGRKVTSATSTDDDIFAVTDNGVFEGSRKKNLLDRSNWQLLTAQKDFKVINYDDDIYAFKSDGLYRFDESDGSLEMLRSGSFFFVNPEGEKLVMVAEREFVTMEEDGSFKSYPFYTDFTWASWDGTSFWASHRYRGLQYVTNNDGLLNNQEPAILINAPKRNLCYKLSLTDNNRLLVAGGSQNYVNIYNPGTVMSYDKDGWFTFIEDSIDTKIGYPYINVTGVAEDPNDDTHHFVSAACCGLFEYKNGKFVHLYNCENSPIMTIRPQSANFRRYCWTSGVTYDNANNLWFLNNQVDTILHVLKADGTWKSFYFPELAGYPTFDNIYFDSRGWVWITHRRETAEHHAGVLCLNYNGTIDNTSDDTYRFQYNFDGASDINQVYNVVEDKDGILWLATSQGPFIIRDPRTFFDSSTPFEQIIVPRNDGTDYGDYLLSGVAITDIAIDGGNRKWFATAENGVYLVSADGLTTIHHFTKENSPLLSNTVYSIAINGETGEVFFGTEAGLISYHADATDPELTLNHNNLKVYPNPVRPDYIGNITVTGFTYDCEVKVTTVGGQLIYKGTSVGGTFTWNGRTNAGKRVSSGMYYIIGYDEKGNKAATTKVLVMK